MKKTLLCIIGTTFAVILIERIPIKNSLLWNMKRNEKILLLDDIITDINNFNNKDVNVICYINVSFDGVTLSNADIRNPTNISGNMLAKIEIDDKKYLVEHNACIVHGTVYSSGYFGDSSMINAKNIDAYIKIKKISLITEIKGLVGQ